MKHLICISASLIAGISLHASSGTAPTDSTITGRLIHDTSIWEQSGSMAFTNPSLKPFERNYSISRLSAGYTGRHESTRLHAENGNNENIGFFDATAYIRSGKNTLWGNARYDNGRIHDISWNESADTDIIYPYLSADETGGYMNLEHYCFSGGFASCNGRIAWGGTIGYKAGLYYRDIDPRPRNVTGCLDAALGMSINIMSSHFAGLSVNFRKYKQSNSIIFQSEMGQSKIYHLTGLGTYYHRFSGASSSTYYTGYRYGASLNIYPASGKGMTASLGLSRFSFDHILRDLNKLPMSSVWHDRLDAQIAWCGSTGDSRYGAEATWSASRRHGKENIFGDPVSSTYPQIGSIEMYADNRYGGLFSVVYERSIKRLTLAVRPSIDYHHRCSVYAIPTRQWLINRAGYGSEAKVSWLISPKVLLSIDARYRHSAPTSASLSLDGIGESEVERILVDTVRNNFAAASATVNSIGITLNADYALTGNYALGLSADWIHDRYNALASQDLLNLSIVLSF